jgi:hypothetical protein
MDKYQFKSETAVFKLKYLIFVLKKGSKSPKNSHFHLLLASYIISYKEQNDNMQNTYPVFPLKNGSTLISDTLFTLIFDTISDQKYVFSNPSPI